jgi:hypothetical protein
MKKILWNSSSYSIYLLLFYYLIGGVVYGQVGVWTRKADVGRIGRQGAVGFSIGNKGYLGTGVSYVVNQINNATTFIFHDDFWEFDPVANVWTQKANFPGGPRWKATGFGIGNKGYLGTGLTDNDYNNSNNDFWEFDPVTNVWIQKRNFGGGLRQAAVGFSIDKKGYIGTGGDQVNLVSDFWEYDPANDIWTKKADYAGNQSRGSAVGFNIGNKGYVGTGSGNNVTSDFWEYDPAIDAWVQKTSFPGNARQGAVGFGIDNKGYIGTGVGSSSVVYNDFWEYDPLINTWAQKANFSGGARCFAIGFSIGNNGFIGTGTTNGPLGNDFWEYKQGTIDNTIANVTVPGTSNPWLAGMPDGTEAAIGDAAPANSPILVNIKLTAGSRIEVSNATGGVSHGFYPLVGPDGCQNAIECQFESFIISHDVGAEYGKSNLIAPINSLVGVFLDNNIPIDPTPPALDFTDLASRDYTELHPVLKQMFFVGNGKTSSGIQQKIFVPASATKLYLGTMDGIEWNNNNGSFSLTVSVFSSSVAGNCGNNNNKVQVCHKGNTICIASTAVAAHLAHGDQLGSCSASSAGKLKGKKGDASILEEEIAASFKVTNAPNPSQTTTRLRYELPANGHVLIKVYDAVGGEMATLINSKHNSGVYTREFSTANLSQGLYYYQVRYTTEQNKMYIKTGKMVVVK